MTSSAADARREVVVDASAVVDLLADTELTQSVAARLDGTVMHAPAHLDAEVLSALGRLARAGVLDEDMIPTRVSELAEAPVQRHALPSLLAPAWALRHDVRLTDALYVALAESLDAPLVTTDARLARTVPRADLIGSDQIVPRMAASVRSTPQGAVMSRTVRPAVRLAVAALAAVTAGVLAAPPAQAVLPTKRVVNDAFQPGKAYDIVRVVLKASPGAGEEAMVRVLHSREVQVGDSIDLWFNLDADNEPDIHVVGDSFSEYNVYKTDNFLEDGKNISKRGCFSLRMRGQLSVVRFDPDCIGESTKFGVSIKSSRSDQPKGNDWVRAPGKFTKKVLSHA